MSTMSNALPKVWLVTGASTGLGLALARSILARGDNVVATGRAVSQFEDLLSDPSIDQSRLRVLALDVTAPFAEIKQQVDAAVSAWGRVDILVNNAGICKFGTTEELGAEGMMHVMQTNFLGALNVTNALLPHMRARHGGSIVFIGSRSAFRNQLVGIGPYSASKAALHSYAETLATEMTPFNINVLIVIPGIFDTKINTPQRAGANLEGYEKMHAGMEVVLKFVADTPKGDPVLGMNALIDVVRGEGRAADRKSPPLWLFLGEDCMRDVRARLNHIGSVMDEWEAVGSGLGLPASL
ncbi:NAD-P-binding protein [Gloeopeniophorella convolvens]|nr:NAD-P-binding protein [Gloeopeniophorella convolvens]